MMDYSEISVRALVSAFGFAAGLIFGATAQKTHFCTMGGISDMVLMGDTRRFRAWMLAAAVALLGTQALWALGYVDLSASIYRTPNFGWAGAIIGGLLFGYGMVLGNGCGNKTLVRLGAGNLKSLVVFLIIAATAYMTLRGLLALARVQLETNSNVALPVSQGLDDLLAGRIGLAPAKARWLLTLVLGGAVALWCFKDSAFRASPRDWISGLVIGLLIPAGWFITGTLGHDDFEPAPVASFSFIAPIGDTLSYLMTYTGASINFGIATVFGVAAGSFLMAVVTRTFRIEGFTSVQDMGRAMTGGVLMGIGGVLALGCTVGQGITGVSTLAAGSFLALGSIVLGGCYGLKYLEEGSHLGAVRTLWARS
jgi:uncharacterized membrane protein YedE/YeeE